MKMTTDLTEFIRHRFVSSALIGEGVTITAMTAARWALESDLTDTERAAGWAHVRPFVTDDDLHYTARVCPALIADHLAGRELGGDTTFGSLEAFTDSTVDGMIRIIEHVFAHEILSFSPDDPLTVDQLASVALLALDVAIPGAVHNLIHTFQL